MSTFNSNRKLIKKGLVSILSNVTYDVGSGAEKAFQLVTDDASQSYTQEPFCLVMRAPSLDEKAAVGEQDHYVSFQVIITLELENGQRKRFETYDYMDDLEELALTALDEADWTDALKTIANPPSIIPWKVNARKVQQYIGEASAGTLLICAIDIDVCYTSDL